MFSKILKTFLVLPAWVISLLWSIIWAIVNTTLCILINVIIAFIEEINDWKDYYNNNYDRLWIEVLPGSFKLLWEGLSDDALTDLKALKWFDKKTLIKRYQMWLYNIKED